jgi:hypothetical protein
MGNARDTYDPAPISIWVVKAPACRVEEEPISYPQRFCLTPPMSPDRRSLLGDDPSEWLAVSDGEQVVGHRAILSGTCPEMHPPSPASMRSNPLPVRFGAMTPEGFLSDYTQRFPWQVPDGTPKGLNLAPVAAFTGRGAQPLEVALATVDRRPRIEDLRRAWVARQGKAASPLLLVAAYGYDGGWKASICGPVGDDPPAEGGLELGEVERIATAALSEPNRHSAIRFLGAIWAELETELPGLRNQGMFAAHELRDGLPLRGDWRGACSQGLALLPHRGRDLVERLGFSVETHATTASVLSITGTKRAVAVFLDEGEEFEASGKRFQGSSPVSHALALADREGLPWVVITRASQIRVYAARADVGVGRKGRSETYVEANLALLPDERAGYLSLLFSADALKERGTFEEILEGSRDYSADLGARLRDRVYNEVVPKIALSLARREHRDLDEHALRDLYEQALTVLFRLLFVAYAEDKDLLPYRSNGAYREHALKTMARELAIRRQERTSEFDPHATDLWDDVSSLWLAVDVGNVEWGVPAYNGGLFSSAADVNAAGASLAQLRLTNAEVGPALVAMLVDEAADGVVGPVDFRSLSVREFGTIYEGLLESSLSVAPEDLAIDTRGTYVPAKAGDEVQVAAGEVYFHDRSGARKATGSYFTKHFAVEHLLDHALEPALDDHIARIDALLADDEQARAADAFFDFRCVDLAMGSGHFLVAAVDRIEARLSAFLALNPIPNVTAELDRLHRAAIEALGPLGEGTEIDDSTLLRRQVARRCIYGIDVNRIAVELARLGIWIHTFVPGLPLSFLDHSLVCGDSLTGIGTLEEAVAALEPRHAVGQASIFRDQINAVLGRAQSALARLARISEASAPDIEKARRAQAEAVEATTPARDLFDLLVAGRVGEVLPLKEFNEAAITASPELQQAQDFCKALNALHFPVTFPEVFFGERTGFDCIVGNPPWEEATVEELGFWALRYPGLRSMRQADQRRAIAKLRSERPDLVSEYEAEAEAMDRLRELLLAGPYPGMGTGDPDLYKAFCWRFWQLIADGGRFGVVLPRSALAAKGSASWRKELLANGEYADVTMLLNTGGWVFDDAEPRYTIGLVNVRKGVVGEPRVHLRGPFASLPAYEDGIRHPTAELEAPGLAEWSDGASFPLLPSDDSVRVFLRLREQPRLDLSRDWIARPYTELHATNDKKHLILDPGSTDHLWPVYKGASFDIWTPDTGEYYAWAEPAYIMNLLWEKRLKGRTAFAGFSRNWLEDRSTLACLHPRIAFRDVTRATDSRTVRVALVPPEVVITNQAPSLLWPNGDERDQAYLLGILCSIPLDWYARRFVETHVNYHIFNAFPVPRPERDDPIRLRVEHIAGRLAAADRRYSAWANAVGVAPDSVTGDDEKSDLVAELDAAVSLLYGLDDADVRVVFETFHDGWDASQRLKAVLDHRRRLR